MQSSEEKVGFSQGRYGKYYLSKEGDHLHLLKINSRSEAMTSTIIFLLRFQHSEPSDLT